MLITYYQINVYAMYSTFWERLISTKSSLSACVHNDFLFILNHGFEYMNFVHKSHLRIFLFQFTTLIICYVIIIVIIVIIIVICDLYQIFFFYFLYLYLGLLFVLFCMTWN